MDANLTAKTPDAAREYKNSVFTMLFDDKASLRELAGALLGIKYGPDAPVEITTLKNVLANGLVNDLSFILDNRLIVLIEHQSTRNDLMPYRMLLYISETFSRLYKRALQYRRSSKKFKLKRPKFIVLYNGVEDIDDVVILRLSDLFAELTPEEKAAFDDLIDLELTVTVYNIKDGRNANIVKYCEKLQGYAIFTDMVRENAKTMPREEAVKKAIDDCIARNILREFFEKHKQEVISMLLTEWDMDTALDVSKEEGREEGIEIGMEKGMKKGESLAAERIALAMKEEGADPNFIAKVTNLPLDTILKL